MVTYMLNAVLLVAGEKRSKKQSKGENQDAARYLFSIASTYRNTSGRSPEQFTPLPHSCENIGGWGVSRPNSRNGTGPAHPDATRNNPAGGLDVTKLRMRRRRCLRRWREFGIVHRNVLLQLLDLNRKSIPRPRKRPLVRNLDSVRIAVVGVIHLGWQPP